MQNIRVGIIGTGAHGSRYANHVAADVNGLELAAVCRRSEEVFEQGKQWNCKGYRDWRQLLADPNVEALILVLPPMLNLEIAKAAVAAGKPLLIEKPLAGTAEDARKIVKLCRENNTLLTVGQTLRYNQVVTKLKEELPRLGRLYSFTANQRLEPSSLSWHEKPELAGAGVSFHTAVHVIDAIRFMTGLEVRRVMALVQNRHNCCLEDLLAVLVEMEDGVVGTLDCSKVGKARSGRFEFVGHEGQLIGEQIYNQLLYIQDSEKLPLDPGPPVPTIIPLLCDWRDYLKGQGGNPVSGEAGLAAVDFCSACLESAATDSWVKLSS